MKGMSFYQFVGTGILAKAFLLWLLLQSSVIVLQSDIIQNCLLICLAHWHSLDFQFKLNPLKMFIVSYDFYKYFFLLINILFPLTKPDAEMLI